ncbi:hypothetical protein ACFSKL_07595 [Belliella marina]|uniref:DUF4398 domain-containing protein n=1 Tax=Belliella marina TaxID=1644146 RepID=A0ABW4VKX7_9BACT
MKKSIFLLFVLLVSSTFVFSQVKMDSLAVNYIYPPNPPNPPNIYDGFTPKESWDIHRAAYIKQLKAKGLTDEELKKSLIEYENQKEEFIAQVKEKLRIAEIQRKNAEEQRALAAIERKKAEELRKQAEIERAKADEQRKLAEIQRAKADEQRKLAEIQRAKADEQRASDAIERKKAEELRKQAGIERAKADEQRKIAEIQRAKADEQRKLAEIQRLKADEQRKKSQEWRNNSENILTKNITLSNESSNSKPIVFKVTSKTTLYIGIRAHISSGNALIEIFNPEGIKEGELSLKAKPSPNKGKGELEYTSGALDKTISNAGAGEWQVKISSQKSNGNVAMSVAQYIKPTVDE